MKYSFYGLSVDNGIKRLLVLLEDYVIIVTSVISLMFLGVGVVSLLQPLCPSQGNACSHAQISDY